MPAPKLKHKHRVVLPITCSIVAGQFLVDLKRRSPKNDRTIGSTASKLKYWVHW
jgi:hypothetical protein